MWLLLAVVFAAPAPVDPVVARLAGPLRAPAAGQVAAYRDATLAPLDPEWVSVVVDGVPGLSDRLARGGWAVEAEAAGRVQVRVRYRELYALAAVDGVRRVREPWQAHPKETTSEGYDATMTLDLHAVGVSGRASWRSHATHGRSTLRVGHHHFTGNPRRSRAVRMRQP